MLQHSFKLEALPSAGCLCAAERFRLGRLLLRLRPLLAIDPVHALMVVHKTLPSQKDIDAPEPVPDPDRGNLVHAHAQQFVVAPFPLIIKNALVQQYQPAATLDGNIIFHPYIIDHPALSGRPQNFFFSTSCKICLSRLRSATSFFSCEFSSSRFLSLRSSETPRPPYFFFQL